VLRYILTASHAASLSRRPLLGYRRRPCANPNWHYSLRLGYTETLHVSWCIDRRAMRFP